MERRDFLKGLGLAGLAGSAAAIKADEPIDRKERLLIEGRMIAIKLSRRQSHTNDYSKDNLPTFPRNEDICALGQKIMVLPDDAIQLSEPIFDILWGSWACYFVHESFNPVDPMNVVPTWMYVKGE